MNLCEAFRALNALNEDTFSVDADGINKLSAFEQSDDLTDEISIIDPDATTEEELSDSYVGKVILDCCVCHSKLYKSKDDVTLDDEGVMANVGEECPYCYTPDGFKVIGEVAPFDNANADSDGDGSEEEPIEELFDANVNLDARGFGGKDNQVSVLGGKMPMGESCDTKKLNEFVSDGGYAEGGNVIDNAPRPNASLHKLKFDNLDGKATRTIKASELKPGMTTETGRIRRIEPDYLNGKKGVNCIYDTVGRTTPSDFFPADKDVEILEEGIFGIKTKREKDLERRRAETAARIDKEFEEKKRQERARMEQEDREKDARSKATQRRLDAYDAAKRNSSSGRTSTSNTGYRGISYSGGDYFSEGLENDDMEYTITFQDLVTDPSTGRKNWETYTRKVVGDKKLQTCLRGFRIYGNKTRKLLSVRDMYGKRVNADYSLEESTAVATRPSIASVLSKNMDSLYSYDNPSELRNAIMDVVSNSEVDPKEVSKLQRALFSKKSVSALLSTIGTYMTGERVVDTTGRNAEMNNSVNESVNNITIETDDDTVDVALDGNGGVNVTAQPTASADPAGDGETIIPVSDETMNEIEGNDDTIEEPIEGDEMDVNIDEFDEESFDELGESYFKRIYENVNGYKTTTIKELNNQLVVEGTLKFNSGNQKKTSFVFEALDIDKNGRARFVGDNKQITEGKKAFTLVGKVSGNKFITESMNYNYRDKGADGKTTRVYGNARISRKG